MRKMTRSGSRTMVKRKSAMAGPKVQPKNTAAVIARKKELPRVGRVEKYMSRSHCGGIKSLEFCREVPLIS
ncbi:hypothetical protein EYF80_058174 [Liparis tanakae]|uniref:Uncharacterized protein n=1 Tax=Liparis tanakae TaxID=230148 RepID=A0A4Z2ES86_9TELE|nr:hypothetical protein EYF80_058174 [Liparis tanakae]